MWLVELLENESDGLTLQEIRERYQGINHPVLGNNVNQIEVSERTIHNWLKEIGEIFKIKISCGRGKRKYYIENAECLDSPAVEMARQIKAGYDQLVRMLNKQQRKSGRTKYGKLSLGFMQVGNSMLNGVSIAISYGKKHNTIGVDEPCIYKPFSIKVIENECYIIGEIRPVSGLWSERIEVYSLDRLQLIEEEDSSVENYTIPDNFKPKDYFECGFGIARFHYIEKYENKPMVVFLNANNETADYIREHPIAPTQTEIESNRTNNKNIFMVVVKPNEDFFTQILSFGEELTITNPDFLKKKGEDKDSKTKITFGFQRYEEDLLCYDYAFLNQINVLKRSGMGVNKLLQSKYGGLTDAELVAKFQQGEEGGYDTLFKKYNNNILRYLQNLTHDRDSAEDLNATTWLRVYKALLDGKYKDSGRFENWIKVIAHNTFRRWCEKTNREPLDVSIGYDDKMLQIKDDAENIELAIVNKERIEENTEILNRLIADLPPQLSRVMELYRKDYTDKEIAEIVGVPVETIKRRRKSGFRAIMDMVD